VLRDALRALAAHHDVLRSRFVRSTGGWRQEVRDRAPDPACAVEDLSGVEGGSRERAMHAATVAAQARIDLAEGPLVSAVLFRCDGEPDRLLLAVHHLVVDGVSMRVLLEDLETAYRDVRDGRPVALPERTLSFRGWTERLARYAGRDDVRDELEYWRAVPREAAAAVPVRLAGAADDAPNTVGRARTASAVVPAEVVAAVRTDALRIRGVQLRDILLAAFLLASREQTGHQALQLDLEGHGREPLDESVDVTRTVGWFTAMYPVVLSLLRHETGVAAVRTVARQLAAVPAKGFRYALLRYLSGPAGAVLAGLPQSRVTFNYLGWFDRGGLDALLGPPLQVPGPLQSDAAPRRHLIEIVLTGVGEELLVDIVYPGGLVADDDARRLVLRLVAIVAELAEEYRTGALAGGSRDFALMHVDARQMSAIAQQVSA
jgi:non-ribosomal peptide synthase protein (TIGR01720 family)